MCPRERGPLAIISRSAASFHLRRVEHRCGPEGPPDRLALLGESEAAGVQVGPAPGQPRRGPVDDAVASPDEPDQRGLVGAPATGDAGALRSIHSSSVY